MMMKLRYWAAFLDWNKKKPLICCPKFVPYEEIDTKYGKGDIIMIMKYGKPIFFCVFVYSIKNLSHYLADDQDNYDEDDQDDDDYDRDDDHQNG